MSKLKYIVKSILKALNKGRASVAPLISDDEISVAIDTAEAEIIELKVRIKNSLTELSGLESYDEFLDILEDNNKDGLKEFLLTSKKEAKWNDLKEILLGDQESHSEEIDNDIFHILYQFPQLSTLIQLIIDSGAHPLKCRLRAFTIQIE